MAGGGSSSRRRGRAVWGDGGGRGGLGAVPWLRGHAAAEAIPVPNFRVNRPTCLLNLSPPNHQWRIMCAWRLNFHSQDEDETTADLKDLDLAASSSFSFSQAFSAKLNFLFTPRWQRQRTVHSAISWFKN